jgi:hypothetical protein
MNNLKKAVIIESLIIAALLAILIFMAYSDYKQNAILSYDITKTGLLSPRVYSNILPPGNLLIYNYAPLEKEIKDYINAGNQNISVFVQNLRDGASFRIDANRQYQAASLNKLPIAIIILSKVERGELSLDTLLPINPAYKDIGSGSLYASQASEMSVRELLERMLQESDNTAFWVLAEQISLTDGAQLSDYLNYYAYLDYSAPQKELNITAESVNNLFSSLYLSTVLNKENSEFILKTLTNTTFDIKKYASLPDDVIVSQKYGSFYLNEEKYFHSCGIMYFGEKRVSYCILTKNIERENAKNKVGKIVNKVYNYMQNATASKL